MGPKIVLSARILATRPSTTLPRVHLGQGRQELPLILSGIDRQGARLRDREDPQLLPSRALQLGNGISTFEETILRRQERPRASNARIAQVVAHCNRGNDLDRKERHDCVHIK